MKFVYTGRGILLRIIRLLMKNIEEFKRAETPTARALLAVERQRERHEAELLASPEKRSQQERFFKLLDTFQAQIFTQIAEEAEKGKRECYIGSGTGAGEDMYEFRRGIGSIFGRNGGSDITPFNTGMLETWLRNKDLQDVFRATPGGFSIGW